MKFLVDAQLPRRMTAWLTAAGCDAVHTLDLPKGNQTTDEQINDVANRESSANPAAAAGGGDDPSSP